MGVVRDVTIDNLTQAVQDISSTGISDSTGQAINNTLGTLSKDTTLQATNAALGNINTTLGGITTNDPPTDTTQQSIASAITGLGALLGSDKANIDGSNIANPSAFRSAIGISNIFTTKDLLTVSNVPTTATSYNLIESFNNYLLIMLSILFYDNVREELTVTANYFNNTSAGLRPTVSYSLANFAIDVYKDGNNAVYVKANTSQSNYKLVITGICKIN